MKLDKIVAKRPKKTVYVEDGRAIKAFSEDFSTSDILNEALNQSRAYEAGINVPKLIEVTKVDGKWAIVSEFIEGETLESLMNKNPEKIDEYLELFLNIQIGIHEKKSPLLNKLKDKMARKIEETGLDATIRYELHTRLHAAPKHTKVCHGDFNPSNIIITKEGKPSITFEKNIGNKYVVVEYISDKHHNLEVQTMWINKKRT